MAEWRKFHSLAALCHVLLLTTASQLYDVTTIYRFDNLEYVADPECSENEFLCGDGACIKRDVLCNRRNDCPDGSDEHDCYSKANQCRDDQYRCNNGNCISASGICNGITDCPSREDEAQCNIGGCSVGQFRCDDGKCIQSGWVCDGDRDCSNGEDEVVCNSGEGCSENQFHCNNGQCIQSSWVCDKGNDCSEGEDEAVCRGCRYKQFRCDDGKCISSSWKCDGDFDCLKGEDEAGCSGGGPDLSSIGRCASSQFRCNFRSCISASLVCNGVKECSNGLDEEMCSPAEPSYNRVKQASVEIRARTNALGLRVVTNDSIAKVPDTETNISSWPSDNETISWTAENWKLNFGPILAAENESYFELESEEGRLKSPAFFPSFEKICVAVESSITPHSQGSLELHAENAFSHNFIVGVIRSHELLEPNVLGWSRQRFLVDVPEVFQNYSLRVVLSAKKSNASHAFVHRIYGCNVHDNEDITIILKRYVSTKSYLSAYTVTERQFTAPEPGTTVDCANKGWFNESISACQCPPGFAGSTCEKGPPKACLHGGSYDIDAGSCRCPVGFTGVLCEQGCGSNLFGNDCGGICSGSLAACKNMILCRPGTNCECAPGIKGDFCDSDCAAGEYGAGCRQTCGKCKDSPCNPYTGVCHQGCLPGFYPPFCKTTYKYLVSAPEVTSSSYDWLTVTVNLAPENIEGDGDPIFYQIQYREQGETEWKEQVPQNIPVQVSKSSIENSLVNVTNLMGGRTYQIRAVLIDKDGESYVNNDLKSTVARTQCTVPEDVDYNLSISNIQHNGFQVQWNFTMTEVSWCPVQTFEVHVRDASRWIIHEITAQQQQTLLITDKFPGSTFYVKVRAIRAEGAASFSPKLAVTTNISNPGEVRNLRVVSSSSTELQLQWDRPWSPHGNSDVQYIVEYECRRVLSCLHEECNPESGVLLVKGTSGLLEDLLPLAQYFITVTAALSENGPGLSILATTNQSMAAVAPDPSTAPVSHLTNTSFVIHWSETKDCKRLNSYMYGYRYELRLANTSDTDWLFEGRTEDTSAEFTGLEAMTEYETRVFLMTSAGWNKDQYLVNIVTTKATVPSPVRDLTVYKSGRRVISLRWSPPLHVYGELVSFRVSYTSIVRGVQRMTSKVIPVEPCVAWPESYCHTITGLRSDTIYVVTVQARNSEVNEDGESSTVSVMTREGGAPGVPVNLRLANRTQVSLTVVWELPRMLNGVLRSFVLNIEEEESYNSLECCQYFPLEEIPFTTEQRSYVKQFRDLRPSSKYRISVTGKTLSLGPSASLSAITRPDASVLPQPPEVAVSFHHGSTVPITLHPVVASDLLRVYLLLVLPNGQNVKTHHTELFNEDLQELLDNAAGSAYYVAAEIVPEEFSGSIQTLIGTGKEATDEAFSSTVDPVLDRGEYRIGLATVFEYSNVYSLGYVHSHMFTIV